MALRSRGITGGGITPPTTGTTVDGAPVITAWGDRPGSADDGDVIYWRDRYDTDAPLTYSSELSEWVLGPPAGHDADGETLIWYFPAWTDPFDTDLWHEDSTGDPQVSIVSGEIRTADDGAALDELKLSLLVPTWRTCRFVAEVGVYSSDADHRIQVEVQDIDQNQVGNSANVLVRAFGDNTFDVRSFDEGATQIISDLGNALGGLNTMHDVEIAALPLSGDSAVYGAVDGDCAASATDPAAWANPLVFDEPSGTGNLALLLRNDTSGVASDLRIGRVGVRA